MYDVTLIPGDGIGPGIAEATVAIIEAAGVPIRWHEHQAGLTAMEELGDPLPVATLESIDATKVALKGPLTTPIGSGFRSVNVALRKHFDAATRNGEYPSVKPDRPFAVTQGLATLALHRSSCRHRLIQRPGTGRRRCTRYLNRARIGVS